MKNMNAKSKKSVIITNKWKKIITNKWKRIDYGNTKQFRFDLLLHHVCAWSDVHACNDNYCGYGQGGRTNK